MPRVIESDPLDGVRTTLREARTTLEGGLGAGRDAEAYLVAGLNMLDGVELAVEQLAPRGERRQRAAELAKILERLEQRARAVRQLLEREAAGCEQR